jgi:hypothetical protein
LPNSKSIGKKEYKIKTSEQLQSVIDKRNTRNEKNAQTQRDRNTTSDMDEARADGDDHDESGYSEDDHGEDEDGSDSHSKRRQARSFYFTTGTVKRMESKEDGILTQHHVSMQQHHSDAQRRHSGCCTALPQVSRRPERQDQGSKGPSWCSQEPPGLYDIVEPVMYLGRSTVNHCGHTHPDIHTYHCVVDTHFSYLSIVIDKPIPLSIGISIGKVGRDVVKSLIITINDTSIGDLHSDPYITCPPLLLS